MSTSKSRRICRPLVENLEAYCLLTATPVAAAAALVHQSSIVDLKRTQVGKDAYNFISQAAPHFAQSNFALQMLTVDSGTRVVRGLATSSYGISFLAKLKATIVFKTSLDNPQPSDVKFTISQVSSLLSGSAKRQVQNAVVNFINHDRAAIEALLPTS